MNSQEEVRKKLREASIPAEVITQLESELLLDADLLSKTTCMELRACGIPMGACKKIKEAFPDPPPINGPCQVCGVLTKSNCSGCNNYTHSPGWICGRCGSDRPCTYGNW